MTKKYFTRVLAVLVFSLIFHSPVFADPTTKIEQQINIINQEYTTTNSTAQPTDNSLGLIQWQGDKYNDDTVYFEAIIYCSSCSGGNAQATATLYSDTGSSVSGSGVSSSNSSYTRIRSGDITSNLTNNEEYTIRLARDATTGTAYIHSARLIIHQDGTEISDSLTHAELGNNANTSSTSYGLITGPPIFLWDEDVHTDLSAVFFEATLAGSDGSATAYAALSSSTTCASTVSGSEVSVSAASWARSRSSDISGNLTDNTEYWVCIKSTLADTANISNAKLIFEQSNTEGIDIIETYAQFISYPTTDSDSTYSSYNFDNLHDPANFSADIIDYYYEASLLSSFGAGYSQLYNVSDTTSISGSEVSNNTSSYSRKRTQNLSSNISASSKTYDSQLKNNSAFNTTASSSWLIILINDVLDADLSFTIAGTSANQVYNDITTSEATLFNQLDFDHLEFGTPRYIAHALTINSNAPSGYTVSVKLEDFLQGLYPGNNIDGFIAPWTAPTTWTEPTGTTESVDTGWIGANTTDTRVPNWSSAAQKFGVVNSSNHIVMQATSADAGTTEHVTYAMEVNINQPADLYSGILVYTVLPTY